MTQDVGDAKLYCVIMAGGRGTRFWPESTSKKPKQYLSLVSDKSLLEETALRFEGLIDSSHRYVVTVKEQEILAKECAKKHLAENGFIYEPSGRNTAPCILLSMAMLESQGVKDEDVVAIVPSDHVILNKVGFQKTVQEAYELAATKKSIVTIGITPNFPHTGYGYVKKGESVNDTSFNVEKFVEKPDFETAKEYLSSGQYFWNAGMFVSSLATLKEEFKEHAPDMFDSYQSLVDSSNDFEKLTSLYGELRKESIDYAIMEKSKRVLVKAAEFDWNDLGSWDALEAVVEKKGGNTLVGNNGEFTMSAEGNIVYAPGKFVSLIDVKDLIVVSNEKTLMVLPKSESQKVKKIVESLSEGPWADELL
ncbi:MAG: mannose-1-phosphate guanylyltransferase [Bacteriovoracaceae bacterium]|nr:mannose-1-phosphate guanylyltransferase [Bacteriovoracaceae bacterium]